MTIELSPLQLEEFLGSLSSRKSRGARADAARFIASHDDSVAAFLRCKRANGQEKLADYYEEELAPYRPPPPPAGPDDPARRMRSFRICIQSTFSFTFQTHNRLARVCGWLLALLLCGMLLLLAARIYQSGADLLDRLTERWMETLRQNDR